MQDVCLRIGEIPRSSAKHNRSIRFAASLLPSMRSRALMRLAAMVRRERTIQMPKKKKVPEAEITTNEPTAEVTLLVTKDKIERIEATEAGVEEPAPEAEPPKKTKKGSKKKAATPTGNATLADIAAGYLAHMEEKGNSAGTIASYGMELKTAMAELGEEIRAADLTLERVGEFFTCKRVTKLRSGKNKSQLSIDKTRRVLRLALVWALERGIIEFAPLPDTKPAK